MVGFVAALWLGAAGGCLGPTPQEIKLQRELDEARIAAKEKERLLAQRDAQIEALREQIEKNRPFQDVDIDKLFTVDRIEIVSRSGGEDFDGKVGDDGVVLYVRPVDRDGDVIKAAGSFVVQLFDVNAEEGPRKLGEYRFEDPDTLASLWYGGFLTNHYTLRCPFMPGSEPSGREVLARVTFVDFLTGRVRSASQTLKIERIDGR